MRQLAQALEELKETPEEKIWQIFCHERDYKTKPSNKPSLPEFTYEGIVTIERDEESGMRIIRLDETGSDPDNPDDAVTLEDVLPHALFIAHLENQSISLRINIQEIDAE